MKPVFGLVPDYALGSIDHLGRDFLAAVSRQTVHEQNVGLRGTYHLDVDLPRFEIAFALGVFGLETHAGPDISSNEIHSLHGIHGILELLVVICTVEPGTFRLDSVTGRSRNMDVEVEQFCSLQPRIAYVIRIPDPGYRSAADFAAVLDERVDIAHDLAGMVLVRQSVDDRHPGKLCKTFDDGLFKRTDHHDIHHAADH